MADPKTGWARWRNTVRDAKASSGLTFLQIAERCGAGVSEDKVRNWFRSTRPDLAELAPIARALSLEPERLLVDLGLLTRQHLDTLLEVYDLRRRLVELEGELRPSSSGFIGSIVASANDAGIAVGLWPATEGRHFGPIDVATRLSFHPTSSDATLPTHLITSMTLRGARRLRRSPDDPPHFQPRRGEYELWSLPTLTAARSPARQSPVVERPDSIFVVAVTQSASPNDVGSLVAGALGFGYLSTVEARAGLHGEGHSALEKNQQRDATARALIEDRTIRRRTVCSHFGTPVQAKAGVVAEPYALDEGVRQLPADDSVCVVWLRESPDLLRSHIRFANSRYTLGDFQRFQQRIGAALEEWGGAAITIDVHDTVNDHTRRDARMDRSLVTAARIVHDLVQRFDALKLVDDAASGLPAPLAHALRA